MLATESLRFLSAENVFISLFLFLNNGPSRYSLHLAAVFLQYSGRAGPAASSWPAWHQVRRGLYLSSELSQVNNLVSHQLFPRFFSLLLVFEV